MMNFIYSWLQSLSILFIMISIIDLIMPKGNLKKYIELIIGLLIIFVIINPFVKLRERNFNLDMEVFKGLYNSSPQYIEDIIHENHRQIEQLYTDKAKNIAERTLIGHTDYDILDIYMDIKEGEEVYGDVRSMKIVIGDNQRIQKEADSIIIGVHPIVLKVNEHSDNKILLFDKIKEELASSFDIDEDSIDIIIENKGRKSYGGSDK